MQELDEKTLRTLPDKLGYGRVAVQAQVSYQTVSKYANGAKLQRSTKQAINDALCKMIVEEASFWSTLLTTTHQRACQSQQPQ